MQHKYRRKTYYIKNSAQTNFIFRFVIISLLGGVIAVTVFNFLSYKKIDSVLYSMRMPKISPGGLLWNEMVYTNLFVIFFILIVFALSARSLFIKLHGPLKKLTSDIQRIEGGDLNFEISLREKDEFKELAQELSKMSDGLNNLFRDINQKTDAIIKATEKNDTSPVELKQAIDELEKAIGCFKQ